MGRKRVSQHLISARMAADMQTMESIMIREEFDGSLENRVIVVAGITYKGNVDDTRLSWSRDYSTYQDRM